jgi:hypothetical protein
MDPVMADSQEAKTCIVYDARLAANVDGQRYFLYADCCGAKHLGSGKCHAKLPKDGA